MNNVCQYKSVITKEHLMFYEMRTTAQLLQQGLDEKTVVDRIVSDNLFQYPTERSLKRIANACVKRLDFMKSEKLVEAIANKPSNTGKQICLYAMMKQNPLVSEFMLTVIGEKYRQRDCSFGKIDVNIYFARLQEQSDIVAAWSESTITKLKQVLTKTLVETGYLDGINATHLNVVLLEPLLENEIRKQGELAYLPAFNCFM